MRKLLYFLAVFTLISCSNPLNRKYDESKFEEDAKEIKESGKLNEEEAKMMAAWIVISKMQGKSLDGKTYNDILEEAKDFKKQQEELAEKLKKEKQEKIDRYGKALTFTVYEKGFHKADIMNDEFNDLITFEIAIQNKTGKEIKAIKGPLSFYDLFGEELYSGNYTQDESIKPNEIYKTQISVEYNQFSNGLKTLKNKELSALKFEYIPEKIIFADGTEL